MNVNKSLNILWFLYKTHKLQVTSHQINSSIDFHQHVCSSCTLSGCGWYVVFMQAVVSGSSVRVVWLCDAGGGQLGPARCHGCAGAALSAQCWDRRGPVHSSTVTPCSDLNTVTRAHTGASPDQCQGWRQWWHGSSSCSSVVVWPGARWCRPAAAWPQQNFIHTQLYSSHRHSAHCASLPAAAEPVKPHCDTVCAPPWYLMQCQTNTYSTDGTGEASCCRHCKYLDCRV